MRRKYIIVTGVIVAIFILLAVAIFTSLNLKNSNDVTIQVYPIVTSTDNNYNISGHWVHRYSDIHKSFDENYSDSSTSELQIQIIDFILKEAERIGEDQDILKECLQSISTIRDNIAWSLPCYVEKANVTYLKTSQERIIALGTDTQYSNSSGPPITTPCWIVAMNGRSEGDMGHYEIYFISIEDKGILYSAGCE